MTTRKYSRGDTLTKIVSVSLSPETVRLLEELMQKWGENRSAVVARAIALAASANPDQTPQKQL